jgi:hypothetical protein
MGWPIFVNNMIFVEPILQNKDPGMDGVWPFNSIYVA